MAVAEQQLYEEDFVRWADQQARALRDARQAGVNLPLDWENLAEEVEALVRSDRRELRNRLTTILVHLMKLEVSPAAEPRRGWMETVSRERLAITDGVLRDSPSLKAEVGRTIAEQMPTAAKLASIDLGRHDELTAAVRTRLNGLTFTEAQVLGNWFAEPRDGLR